MRYKGIIFDFFGVLCTEIAPFWLAARFAPDTAMEIKAGIIGNADRGLISQDEMFVQLANLCGYPKERVETEWLSYVRINNRLVDKIGQIRERARVGLLTNSPSPLVRGILNEHNLADLFDDIVVSSEVRCAKPDKAIYTIILNKLSLSPIDTVLIDDNPENIKGAIESGMFGIIFTSNEQLDGELS